MLQKIFPLHFWVTSKQILHWQLNVNFFALLHLEGNNKGRDIIINQFKSNVTFLYPWKRQKIKVFWRFQGV